MDYSRIPQGMRDEKRWGLFRTEWDEERQKFKKFPINPYTGQLGSSTNKDTWAEFDFALEALERLNMDGLAFYLGDGYVGIDLDHIGDDIERYMEGDRTDNIVHVFMNNTNSYTELSISGSGIHIIGKGKMPGTRRRKGDVEMYDSGRFFAITGNIFGPGHDIANIPDANMKYLYHRYLEPKVVDMPNKTTTATFDEMPNLSVPEIVEAISNSKQAGKFEKLYRGNWEDDYESQSSADMAFANMLAFWTAHDFDKMDAIFRDSGLYRQKYDEKRGAVSYGTGLLNKAIADSTDYYKGPNQAGDFMVYVPGLNMPEKEKQKFYSWDDTGVAKRMVDEFGEYMRYSYTNKSYYFYDGTVWLEDNCGMTRRWLDLIVEAFNKDNLTIDDMDEEEAKKLKDRFIKKLRSNNTKNAVMREVQHHIPVQATEFDQDDMLFNTQNGYIDLATGDFHDHDSKKMFQRISNTEYTDNMQCPMWLAFLNQIFDGDQEVIHYIQKAVGYSLTGSTREQVMFVLFGSGANGKSVFIDTIEHIMGSYKSNISADALMVKGGGSSGHNEKIARLAGARFVSVSEPNEKSRLDEGLIKSLTGGDTVSASFKGGHEFDYKPKYKIWMATNHKPIIRGTDIGIWRRIPLIPFKVTIPKEKQDKNLTAKLATELPGILQWALEGALMWQKEGLDVPESIAAETAEYKKEMDPIEMFFDEVGAVRGESETVDRSYAFKAYSEWTEESREFAMKKSEFNKKMEEKFGKTVKVKGTQKFKGISIPTTGKLVIMNMK
jgi:putative DNA primase/helicase